MSSRTTSKYGLSEKELNEADEFFRRNSSNGKLSLSKITELNEHSTNFKDLNIKVKGDQVSDDFLGFDDFLSVYKTIGTSVSQIENAAMDQLMAVGSSREQLMSTFQLSAQEFQRADSFFRTHSKNGRLNFAQIVKLNETNSTQSKKINIDISENESIDNYLNYEEFLSIFKTLVDY